VALVGVVLGVIGRSPAQDLVTLPGVGSTSKRLSRGNSRLELGGARANRLAP